ncbi:T9SS type B sorting domain-containing protein [Emticicia agri]|uniref:Gliding motility-associated C-terminal domain-containing protein n=1 Tax=Emticicia agri TaxID=2492393 RepID=A0A4V1ZCZ3_9BACT|nr:gliding motility-associated C-terminal domain-containing protein [Emticicia agri]RYU94360.1 gliding motility-associated C-terminal domain-containing protein [Emticicia agri]
MKSVLRIILLFFVSISTFAQGICDNATPDGFVFDGPSAVCIGEKVKVKDNNSGATDIKYIFGYSGQAASKLPTIPAETGPNAEWPFLVDGNYIILQYGKKNGGDFYSCKVVTVRKNTKPVASIESCNNSSVSVAIPADSRNNFDYYTINWGDGTPLERVTQLPYNRAKNLSTPRTVTVNGVFNTASSCPANTGQYLPYLTPGTVPGGYESPNHINVSELVLKTADEAVLTINGGYEAGGYDLFMTEQGTPYSFTPFKTNVFPGEMSIAIPDTNKSYCFYLSKGGGCGAKSAEICTTVLNEVNPLSITTQEILWENYPTEMSNIILDGGTSITYGRFMNRTMTLLKEEDDILLPEIPVSSSPYTDNVDCKKKYCYRIKTETEGKIFYWKFKGISISKPICLERKDYHPEAITDALVTVTDANTSEIIFTDNSPWTIPREKYILYHDNGTEFKEIKTNPTVAPITDTNVDNSLKSNCYKIAFLDQCGSTSMLSDAFCTVLLSEQAKNELLWTGQTPFADTGISNFEIQSYDENTGTIATVTSPPLSSTQFNYSPDLSGFEEEAKFRIRIIAPDGSESFSNVYTIPLAVKILLPDAFTPNNDAINDNLEVKGTFRRIVNFDFQIYNRWGNPVFTSNDPLKTWDGNFQGTGAPVDTYTYKIFAKLIDGTEVNKTGKFLLMR